MAAIRRFAAGDAPAAVAIIAGLPEYFTDDVPAKVQRDALDHEGWVLTDSGAVVGVAVAARKSPAGAEILWIAVEASRRGHGFGTQLLNHILDGLAAAGISVVEAKTLDRSSGYRAMRRGQPLARSVRPRRPGGGVYPLIPRCGHSLARRLSTDGRLANSRVSLLAKAALSGRMKQGPPHV